MDPHRIAEIIVVARDGRRSRGSGYRVGAVAVLTAAHMVADAASVTIRFDGGTPGEWTGRPSGLWTDDQSDLAVLHVDADNNIDTVPLGRIGDRAAVLPVRAAGFPRFKIRRDDGSDGSGAPYRDLHQADGTAAVLSNRKEGTLEVTVTPPERDDDAAHSPWEGMSGAAVWVNGRIVAVVARHYPSDGLGRLSATRLDRCLDRLDASRRDELLRQLGVAATGSAGLTEVLPPTTSALTRTAYRLQVQDIAPDELIGRERELDDIVAFCAEDRPYEWWQAGPWAGKTALMSWFVLHPPAGIDVVSFFVTARLAGQSDSEAFVEAMHEQLASLIGESASGSSPGRARQGHLLRLLDAAADRARERGERILIVVDGLDEDTGPSSGSGLPSIASLLPRRLPDEVRVLVASRPHPELPLDLPDRHPLRSVTPLRLTDSSHAHGIELAAKRELARLFAGGGVQVELLGLLTAASGGLTASNLEELTGSPPFIIEELVSGALGRAVARRSYAASDAVSDVIYLFGHETLREVAEQQLGSTVIRYRDRLHAWAESYRQRGWPTDTPIYLLREYTRILMPTTAVPSGDLPRLMAYATDPGRHDRLLDFTGGDFFALTEVRNAQSLNLRQPEPDVGAALSLAMSRDRLVQRSGLIPTGLPAVWAKLGQPARAEGLARGIHDPFRQVEALCSLVLATWRAADHDRAEQLLRAAVEVAETIGDDPIRREAALLRLVDVACTIAQTGVAHALTGMITDAERVAPALARVVGAVAEGGAVDRALTLLDEIGSPGWQAAAMVGICAAASRPDDDRSRSLVDRARELIVDLPDPAHRAPLLTRLAVLSTGMRDGAFPRLLLDEAAASAEEIDNSAQRTEALARIAVSGIDAGPEPARAVLARLKATARTLDAAADAPASDLDTGPKSADVGKLVDAAALLGDDDLALSFSRRLSEPRACARALVRAAAVAARTGLQRQASSLLAQAEQAAAWIEDTYESAVALGALIDAAVLLGELGRAEALANAVPHPFRQAEALLRVASAAVERGDLETARTLVGRSEALGREESGALPRASAARLVEAALAAGDLDAAELLARRIPHSYEQAAALLGVIDAAVAAGDVERAATIAVVVGDARREEALIRAVEAHLSVGDVDRALGLARTISRPHGQAAALEQVIDHALDHGDVEGARELAHEILDPGRRAVMLGRVAADALVRSADFVDMQFLAGGAFRDFLESAQVATVERLIKLAVVDDDFRRAERFVDGSPEHSRRDLQNQLVDALLAAAQFDRAQELINRIDGLAARSRALAAYAEAAATADPDRSRSALVEADELARRDGTWTVRARVASAAAAVGALDMAEALLDDIRDRPGSVEPRSVRLSRYGFGDLIDARVRRGDLESAIKLVHETSGERRLPAIRRLVKSMVAAGYGDRAEDVPTSVTGTQTQAAVWAALARATLDAAGPSSSAVASDARRKSRAYVAKALELDRWVGHLVLACRLDRSALDVALQYHGIILDGRGL